jgi:hypothetical protein
MSYTVDKDIRAPAGGYKYPWDEMEVGDSFFAPVTVKMLSAASWHITKTRGWKFSVRREGEGARIWRIASKAL